MTSPDEQEMNRQLGKQHPATKSKKIRMIHDSNRHKQQGHKTLDANKMKIRKEGGIEKRYKSKQPDTRSIRYPMYADIILI